MGHSRGRPQIQASSNSNNSSSLSACSSFNQSKTSEDESWPIQRITLKRWSWSRWSRSSQLRASTNTRHTWRPRSRCSISGWKKCSGAITMPKYTKKDWAKSIQRRFSSSSMKRRIRAWVLWGSLNSWKLRLIRSTKAYETTLRDGRLIRVSSTN